MRLNTLDRSGLLIVAASGILIVALWVAIFSALHTAERRIYAHADAEGRNLARSLVEHVASSVRAVDFVLLDLCAAWDERAASFPIDVARDQQSLRREYVSEVIVADAGGRVVYSSLPGYLGDDVSNRAFFKAHKRAGWRGLHISAPAFEPVLRQWTISFTRPIIEDGRRFGGVIALFVPPPELERIYDDINLGEGSVITLARSDGQILARSRNLAQTHGVSLAEVPALLADAAPSGSYRRTARTDGVERLYDYQKVPGYPLTLFVGQAVASVLAPYRDERAIYVAAGTLATLLLPAIALLLALRQSERRSAGRERARLEAELRQGEERLRLIAESIDEVVWSAEVAAQGGFYASPAYERVWGRPRDSLKQGLLAFSEAIHPQDRQRAAAEFDAETKAGRRFEREYRIVRPDGSVRWIWERAFPVCAASGEVVRYVGAAQDVTKRKLAEQALREKIAHLQLVYDASSVAIVDIDARGVIAHANQRMARMFVSPLQGLIGSEYLQRLHPEERESVSRAMSALLAGEVGEIDRERRYLRADGSEFWGHATGRGIVDASGKPVGLLVVIADITEAKRATEALRRNEAYLRELLDAFPIAVAYIDKAERLSFANRIYRSIYGEDYAGRTVREYAGEQAYAVLQPLIRRALAGEPVEIERSFVGADGEVNTGLLRYFPDRDAAGEIAGYFVFREDVTARRRAEAEIRKLNEDLERRVRERTAELWAANEALQAEVKERRLAESAALELAERLQRMTRRLGEAQEIERRRLAAELHDGVCSNLAAVGLNLALLQKQLPHGDPAGLQLRLSDLIAQIDEAKSNAKDISIDLRPLMLEERDLYSAVEEYAQKFAGSTGIAVDVKGSGVAPRLSAEQKIALFRIVQEALTNCAKHAQASAVSIEFQSLAGRLLLCVADDGIGIDRAAAGGKQPGLGLLSMQERAEALGGSWQLESIPGKGTCVRVSVAAVN